jgi:hypothetical protein
MFAVAQRGIVAAPLRRTAGVPARARRGAVAVRAEASSSSYYMVVKGMKLDRKVVDDCVAFEGNNGSIDKHEAERILADILDGPKRMVGGANTTETTVTNCELDTAQYVFDNFKWDEDAKEWFYNELTSRNW